MMQLPAIRLLAAMTAAVALALAAGLSDGSKAVGDTPLPKPSPTGVPTPKPLPKGFEILIFNGHVTPIKGFVIFATPTPPPTPKPPAVPGVLPTPKPSSWPSEETITNIDKNCEGAELDSFLQPVSATPPPGSIQNTALTATPTPSGWGCSATYMRAKDFFKAIGAKIVSMPILPSIPDGALPGFQTTQALMPVNNGPPVVYTQPLAPLYVGPISVKFCGKTYTGVYFLDKLGADTGSPNIVPTYFLDAFNNDLKVQKFSYTLQTPDPNAAVVAQNVSGSYQPGATLNVKGPITCKKGKKLSGAYEFAMESTITVVDQSHTTLSAHVSADFGLKKDSGNVTVFKSSHTVQLPSTAIVASGSGELHLDSFSDSMAGQVCDKQSGARWVVGSPQNGTGDVTLVGSAKSLTLVFGSGLVTNSSPQVSISCKGYGGPTGPLIWGEGFNAAHIDAVTVGGLFGGMADVGYAIPLEGNGKVFTYTKTGTVTKGSATITEDTTITVTKLSP
ncbi:MAG: hypothetical protein ACYDA1_08115 [Vulcanimicrobiaceae bacterium]